MIEIIQSTDMILLSGFQKCPLYFIDEIHAIYEDTNTKSVSLLQLELDKELSS